MMFDAKLTVFTRVNSIVLPMTFTALTLVVEPFTENADIAMSFFTDMVDSEGASLMAVRLTVEAKLNVVVSKFGVTPLPLSLSWVSVNVRFPGLGSSMDVFW